MIKISPKISVHSPCSNLPLLFVSPLPLLLSQQHHHPGNCISPLTLPLHSPTPSDPDYQSFVKAWEEGPRPAPTAQALLEAHEAAAAEQAAPVVTALMAFLQQQYEAGGSTLMGRRGMRGPRGSGAGGRREAGGRLATVEEVGARGVGGGGGRGGRGGDGGGEGGEFGGEVAVLGTVGEG